VSFSNGIGREAAFKSRQRLAIVRVERDWQCGGRHAAGGSQSGRARGRAKQNKDADPSCRVRRKRPPELRARWCVRKKSWEQLTALGGTKGSPEPWRCTSTTVLAVARRLTQSWLRRDMQQVAFLAVGFAMRCGSDAMRCDEARGKLLGSAA